MRINLISGLVKPGDQALHSIFAILKFSAFFILIPTSYACIHLAVINRKGDHAEWTGELTCTHVMSAVVEEMKKRQVGYITIILFSVLCVDVLGSRAETRGGVTFSPPNEFRGSPPPPEIFRQ